MNPSVCVEISSLKTSLFNATMPTYNNDVIQHLDVMYDQYTHIYENHGERIDYTLNLFNTLSMAHND